MIPEQVRSVDGAQIIAAGGRLGALYIADNGACGSSFPSIVLYRIIKSCRIMIPENIGTLSRVYPVSLFVTVSAAVFTG